MGRTSPPAVSQPYGARKSPVNAFLRKVAVTRVKEAVDRVRDQTRGCQAEQIRAVALMRELLQRAVEPDCVPRLVVGGRLDREGADQREHDEARDMAGNADDSSPPLHS